MDELPEKPAASARGSGDRGLRLDSWKEIAAHLNRDVRTVQRWEKTANLPVRRLHQAGLRTVFAYTVDLDDWLRQQGPAVEESSEADAVDGAVDQETDQKVDTPVVPARRRRWLLYAGAAVLLAAASAVAVWRKSPAPMGPFTARPITSDPGIERDPDISPDGKYVAYAAETPEIHSRIDVRLIEGGEARAITSSPDDEWSPAWSPDGGRIAFLRGDLAGKATLLITSALGGEERTLTEVRAYPRGRTLLIGHLVAWTPDGRHVVVPDRGADGKGGLVLVDAKNGERTPLTSPAAGTFDVEPSLSSDGRLLLFNRIRGQTLSDVFLQNLDAAFRPVGSPRKLPPAGDWNGTPRLLEDRREVLVCAGSVPRLSLWRERADGSGKPVSLGIIGDNAVQTAVHRASGRIVFRTFRIDFDVLRFPLPAVPSATHRTTPETLLATTPQEPPVQEFLQSTYADRSPVYSPDGSHVAFISDRTGRRQLWVSDGAGEKPTEWTQPFEADIQTPSWSQDGSRIVFTGEGPAGLDQLFVADRTTRTAARVTNDGLDYAGAVWSHDGANLYAAAAVKNVYSIYRLPSTGGAAEKILSGYAAVAGAEPTGKGLYAVRRVDRNQTELAYIPFPAGKAEGNVLTDPSGHYQAVHLAAMNFLEDAWVTRDGIYYLERRADKPLAPVALKFRTHDGAVRLLQEYSQPPGRGLSVSADGRFAVTTRVVPPISDLVLLEAAK
jgi:Tol biopolymer transport system component